MKKLVILALIVISTGSFGQKVTSSRSNSIQLELSGIAPAITWMSPSSYETNLSENIYSVKVGVKSEGKLKSA